MHVLLPGLLQFSLFFFSMFIFVRLDALDGSFLFLLKVLELKLTQIFTTAKVNTQ